MKSYLQRPEKLLKMLSKTLSEKYPGGITKRQNAQKVMKALKKYLGKKII